MENSYGGVQISRQNKRYHDKKNPRLKKNSRGNTNISGGNSKFKGKTKQKRATTTKLSPTVFLNNVKYRSKKRQITMNHVRVNFSALI